jgi:hypothetical protein
MSHWMFNCKKASAMVSESMDRKFPRHLRIMIAAHLLLKGRYCNRFKKQLVILRNAVGLEDIHEADVGSSPGLSKETRARIKRAMRDLLPDSDPVSLNTQMFSFLTKRVNICKY